MKNCTAVIDRTVSQLEDGGNMTFGPLQVASIDSLQRKMEKYGVYAFGGHCNPELKVRSDGKLFISASSPEVTGYLYDEEHMEASSSDVEAFLMDVMDDGDTIYLDGQYSVGNGGYIRSEARYHRKDDQIILDMDRKHFDQNGIRKQVFQVTDLHEHEIHAKAKLGGNVVSLTAFKRTRTS